MRTWVEECQVTFLLFQICGITMPSTFQGQEKSLGSTHTYHIIHIIHIWRKLSHGADGGGMVMVMVVISTDRFISGNGWWRTESLLNPGDLQQVWLMSPRYRSKSIRNPPKSNTATLNKEYDQQMLNLSLLDRKTCSHCAEQNHWWSPSGQKPWVHHKIGWCHRPQCDP